jgi:peptidylprolyl isomerase
VIPEPSKVGVVRKIAAIVLAAAFVVSVAACADLPAEVQGCVPTFHAGAASKAVTTSGAIGSKPKVHVPTPTTASKVENSVATRGKGLILGKGDIAEISSLLYLGTTGKLVGATATTASYTKSTAVQVPVGDSSTVLPPTVTKALMCMTVGSRIVTVLSAAQVYGSSSAATSAAASANLQFTGKTTMVLVTDIGMGYRGRAVGILQPLQSGFPSVVTSPDGTPGLTLDLQEPPKTLQHELVRGGSGAKVKAGQKVLLQVQGVAWTDPAPTSTFDSTWTDHTPRFYTLTALAANAGGQFLDKGSVKALVGQRVGSQVLVVVPPSAGYPKGKQPSGYPTGTTLIFVYDILGTY